MLTENDERFDAIHPESTDEPLIICIHTLTSDRTTLLAATPLTRSHTAYPTTPTIGAID